jgi:hypothetical protein
MPNLPDLQRENDMIQLLVDNLGGEKAKAGSDLFREICDDWLKSLAHNKYVNTLLQEASATQLKQDLTDENRLLTAFLETIANRSDTGSPLSARLRERWSDVFMREMVRNRELIDEAGV